MNTKSLMAVSAVFMATLGIVASFMPQEILAYYGSRPDGRSVLLMQVAGALYLGFAMLNWTARSNLTGGIYSRPVALGNFAHFAIGAVTLLKALIGGSSRAVEAIVGTVIYSLLAVWFGLVLFTHPIKNK
jgi:hypothetical protein